MENGGAKILAVDDSPEALFALEEVLGAAGYAVQTAANGAEALKSMERDLPDVVLSDINMPIMDGYELVRRMRADPVLRFRPILLITARDTLDDVIKGLEQGADDYLTKPFKSAELLARIKAALRIRKLYAEFKAATELNDDLARKLHERFSFGNIVGQSAVMRFVFDLVEKVAPGDVPVLITGESGTGKELVASAIHYNGPRRGKPFIIQNCSAFNENLLESELFGHVKGAFTGAVKNKEGLFEAADGGTLFLDELGEMSAAMQVKLLRVLQDGTFLPVGSTEQKKVNVRVLAATNRNLRQMVAEGIFREDLFYRISVVNIKLPPLRERKSDITLLMEHFLTRIAARTGKPRKIISNEALLLLCDYSWPGNIRELQNEIERLVLLSAGQTEIPIDLISEHIVTQTRDGGHPERPQSGKLREALEALECDMIRNALAQAGGNKSEAARALGIARSNLIAKVQSYKL